MKRILFQGDSITDAGRNREDPVSLGVGYPNLVSASLGYDFPNDYEFINRGISGNRIVDLYARMKRDIINLAPDYMSILIGVNDFWHELTNQCGVSAPKYEKIYTMLLEEIYEELPNIKIMILEPYVIKGSSTDDNEKHPDRWRVFDEEVKLRAQAAKRVAEKFNLPFVKLQERFDNAIKITDNDTTHWAKDGVHPTFSGHELIARAWIEAFEKYMR